MVVIIYSQTQQRDQSYVRIPETQAACIGKCISQIESTRRQMATTEVVSNISLRSLRTAHCLRRRTRDRTTVFLRSIRGPVLRTVFCVVMNIATLDPTGLY